MKILALALIILGTWLSPIGTLAQQVIATSTPGFTPPPTLTETPTSTSTEMITSTTTPGAAIEVTITPQPSETPTQIELPTETPTQFWPPSETPTQTGLPSETPTQTGPPTETPTQIWPSSETPTQTGLPSETPTQTGPPTETPIPSSALAPERMIASENMASLSSRIALNPGLNPAITGAALLDPSGQIIANSPVNPDGTFTLTAAAGSYTLRLTAPGCLTAQTTVTVVAGQPLNITAANLLEGDINGDNSIDALDLMSLNAAFETASPQPPAADLNGDGQVDLYDLTLIARNWRMAGPTTW